MGYFPPSSLTRFDLCWQKTGIRFPSNLTIIRCARRRRRRKQFKVRERRERPAQIFWRKIFDPTFSNHHQQQLLLLDPYPSEIFKLFKKTFFRSRVFRQTTVWPDWAIFERSWWRFFFKKFPKFMMSFWAKVKKHQSLVKATVTTFWGTFGKNLGYFIFQPLVTLRQSSLFISANK